MHHVSAARQGWQCAIRIVMVSCVPLPLKTAGATSPAAVLQPLLALITLLAVPEIRAGGDEAGTEAPGRSQIPAIELGIGFSKPVRRHGFAKRRDLPHGHLAGAAHPANTAREPLVSLGRNKPGAFFWSSTPLRSKFAQAALNIRSQPIAPSTCNMPGRWTIRQATR